MVDNPLSLLYNYIMKKVKSVIKKVRARNGTDIYYTISTWPTKEIDGVTFIPVTKEHPDDSRQTSILHWMKKDNMEYVK